MNHGYVTSCQLPKPKWRLDSKTADVEVGDDAVLHHATLKIHGIPVFYFPYMEHPVDNLGRKSGFLIPTIGQSNTRARSSATASTGQISRNADATLGAALYSSRGWAQFGDFRAIGYSYGFQAAYYGVIDNQGAPQGPYYKQNQGGEDLRINAFKNLGDGFRAVLSVDYLSSFIFRQVFALGFSEAIQSEVRSTGFIYKNWNGYSFGVMADSYQDYQSDARAITSRSCIRPRLSSRPRNASSAGQTLFTHTMLRGPGVSRNEIGFETAPIVGRVDAAPYIAWPKLFDGWTFRPQIGARETYYSQRLEPGSSSTVIGISVNNPINRNVANASFELRPPTLSRIFDRKPFGRAIKHTIEPYAIYRYQSGIDNFSQILRFDERDILADTNEVEYGFVNRLFSKKTKLSPRCFQHPEYSKYSESLTATDTGGVGICKDKTPASSEIFSWAIAQKYYGKLRFRWSAGTRNSQRV